MTSSDQAPNAKNRSAGRERLFAIISVTLSLLVCLVILEFAAFVYLKANHGYDGAHLMNYQFDPYKNIRPTPGFVDTRGIQHNSDGFRRSSETPQEKPADTLRVFLMGGSTAYGLGSLSQYGAEYYLVISNDETIDYHLEQILKPLEEELGKKVEVINAAVTSFYSHHHLIYLNQTILRYDPDVIIFLDGFNDYFPFYPGFDQFKAYAYSERATSFLGEPTVSAWAHYTGWWLFRKSHLVNVSGRILKRVAHALRGDTTEGRAVINVEESIANLKPNAQENWVKMVERNGLILQHEGVDAIFALQPEIAFKQSKTLSPLEEKIYDEMVSHWPENYIEVRNEARPIVWSYLQEAADVSGATAVDLTDIYGDVTEDVYTDYCHLTSVGNRVVAESLAPLVAEKLRQKVLSATP